MPVPPAAGPVAGDLERAHGKASDAPPILTNLRTVLGRSPAKTRKLGRFANSIRDPRLVLADVEKLANLMIQHGIDIQTKEVIKITRIDLDFPGGGD